MKTRASFTRELRDPRPGEIESFLGRHGVRKVELSQGELRFAPCPICRNQKKNGQTSANTRTNVNLKSGLWRCFGCRTVGNWLTLTRAFGDELPRTDRYKDQRPEDTWKLKDYYAGQQRQLVTSGAEPALLHYCHSRGLNDATLDRFLVTTGFFPSADSPRSPRHDALRWPLHAWEGGKWVMVNAKMKKCLNRQPDEARSKFERGGGPTQLAIGQHLVNPKHGKRIFVWEGEMDAMIADQLGLFNSVSLPNGAGAVNVGSLLRYIPDDWTVYLGMDMDDAGRKAIEAFFAQIDPKRLVQFVLPPDPNAAPNEQGVQPPYKDLNDWYLGAGGLITAEDVMSTAAGLSVFKMPAPAPRRAPVSLREIQAKVASRPDVVEGKPRLIAPLPWPALNGLFKGGLMSKQTTGWLAPSGIGKTTAVNQIAIHAAANGCKTGLISLEDSRDELYENLNQAALGWLSPEAIGAAADNLWVSELEGDEVTSEQIMDELERMADSGVRLAIIDNLDHTADRADQHRGMAGKLLAYAAMIRLAKAKDMHIIAVWQCNKVDRDIVVNSGNQKGYGQTFLDASNYLNMNRFIVDGREVTRIETEKARSAGTSFTKRHVWLTYDGDKRCFFESDNDNASGGGANGVITF